MTIKYSGARDYDNRCAVIEFKDKEQDKFDKVIESIEEEAYIVLNLCGSFDENQCYIEVEDKDDFDYLKKIYMRAKRA